MSNNRNTSQNPQDRLFRVIWSLFITLVFVFLVLGTSPLFAVLMLPNLYSSIIGVKEAWLDYKRYHDFQKGFEEMEDRLEHLDKDGMNRCCPNCGEFITEDNVFCPQCGRTLYE